MIPEPALILILSFALMGLGWFFARLYYRAAATRAERDGWKAAVRFYQARDKQARAEARL